ncbi:MAG: FAD-dependent oxidoreductase [Acidimicrobiales bacterium]|nr:FAD-dependent oxidoreductase [Acidimicrobiales bacterium]
MPISRRTVLKGSALLVLYAAVPGCAPGGGDEVEDADGAAEQDGGGATGSAVPEPDGWVVTRWRADPFARGSYSFLAVDSSPDDRRALAAPVGDRLFFAGEATSVANPATVHGALESGRAAADAVDSVAEEGARILVIGAGMAGLGAARALDDLGYDVTVVEGRDRMGGRTFTVDTLGVPLDLGASWIHGTDGNPLTALADELGVERSDPTDYDNEPEYAPDGVELTDTQYATAEAAFDSVMEVAATAAEEQAEDGPLADVVWAAAADLDLSDDDLLVLTHYLNTSIEGEYAGGLGELSTWWWEEGEGYDGGDVVFPDGYVQLVDGLAEGLAIDLGAPVEEVAVVDGGVVVTIGDDSTYEADHVVVTVPLGVLKAGTIAFEPPLPDAKATAIERIGMGLLDKTYLRFPEVFWDADADLIGWVSPDGDGRWAEWVNMAKVTGEPILLGFNAAAYAEQVEAMSDEEVVADAMAVLRTIYGP